MEHQPQSKRSFLPHSATLQRVEQTNTSHNRPEPKNEGFITEIVRFSLIALLIVLPIRLFIAQPFIVSGASMETTFTTGEYLIIDQLSYRLHEPARGDIIVFRYPKDPSKFFIKRVIGIPGDTIAIDGGTVTISNKELTDGVVLEEGSYIHPQDARTDTIIEETLGDGEYFVMGDNRGASSDSRMWGVLQRDKIIGKAFLRLFPFTRADLLPGEYDINAEITHSP